MSATVLAEEPDPAASAMQEPHHEEPLGRPVANASPAAAAPAIRQAIEEIYKINKDLEWVLLEMEKAVETLEEAEVQKYADEREIESLKNAMRQFNRTRETIQRVQQGGPQRHDPRGRPPRERDQRDRDRRFPPRQRHEPRPERHNPEPGPSAHEPPPPRDEERSAEPPPEPEIPV